jgi:hypothetical protein
MADDQLLHRHRLQASALGHFAQMFQSLKNSKTLEALPIHQPPLCRPLACLMKFVIRENLFLEPFVCSILRRKDVRPRCAIHHRNVGINRSRFEMPCGHMD